MSGLFINPAGELVAWGTSQRGSDATFDYTTAFWATSDNGETWRENRLDGPGDWLSVRDVAISGDDFVAVADQGGYGPGAWWSDDGFTWAAASVTPEAPPPLVDYMIAVAAGAEGYLAVGGAGGDDNTRLAGWFSTTGKEWTRLDIDLGPGWFEDVVASPDGGFVAVGTDWSGASATDEIWLVSSDGQDWEPAKPLDKTAGPGEDHIGDLLTFDGGYLAFGMHAEAGEPVSCKGCPWDPERWRIYTSPDGQTWDRHEIGGIGQAMPRLPWYRAVQAWQDGLIAVGSDSENNYRVWTSTDGVTWEAIGAPFGSPMDRSYFTVLVDDHRIVTAGMGEYGGLVTVGTTSP